jgi:predicted metal-dependent hydrolase
MKASGSSAVAAVVPKNHWDDAEELRWAVRHWATRIGVKTPQIHLREMRRKWASVSSVGRLTLNTELIELPKDLGEFVIVHELVHLLTPNHGKVFKSFMHAYLPDWQEREQRLRKFAGLCGAA